jgi:hypothetical protein
MNTVLLAANGNLEEARVAENRIAILVQIKG